MTRFAFIFAFCVLALSTACDKKDEPQAQAGQPQQSQAASPSQPDSRTPPDFSLASVETGKEVRLSALKGKVVLIDFWATWCGPCRMEIPHFVELQKQYSKDLRIVGISLDQQGEMVVKPFMRQWKINYEIVIDSTGAVQSSYGGIRSIPTALLVGRDGQVKDVFVGYRSLEFGVDPTRDVDDNLHLGFRRSF